MGLSIFSWASCPVMDMLPSTIHYIYIIHSSWADLWAGGCYLMDQWHFWCLDTYYLHHEIVLLWIQINLSFYRELPSVFHLSCEDTLTYETGVLISTTILFLIPFSVFLATYTLILVLICKQLLLRAEKAFSTCSSHLTVVNLYYGANIFMYMFQILPLFWVKIKSWSIFSTILIPMLNPMIYSLSNKDAMGALKKML